MPTCPKLPYPSAQAAALALRRMRADPGPTECGIHPCFHEHDGWQLTSQAAAARNEWTVAAFRRVAF